MTTSIITGTITYSTGLPHPGCKILVKKIINTDGSIISDQETIYKTNSNGEFNLIIPKNSYAYIYIDAWGFNKNLNGVQYYVGNDDTYELRLIESTVNYPTLVPIAIPDSSSVSLTGNQSISGYKSFVVLPSNNGSYFATWQYLLDYYVPNSGNSNIGGTKVFSSLPSYSGNETPASNNFITYSQVQSLVNYWQSQNIGPATDSKVTQVTINNPTGLDGLYVYELNIHSIETGSTVLDVYKALVQLVYIGGVLSSGILVKNYESDNIFITSAVVNVNNNSIDIEWENDSTYDYVAHVHLLYHV